MPNSTFVAMAPEEQAQMLAALRRARYGYLLALHILLLCATGHNPTEIAAVLFCSRSSVYRTVRAYRAGALGWEHDARPEPEALLSRSPRFGDRHAAPLPWGAQNQRPVS